MNYCEQGNEEYLQQMTIPWALVILDRERHKDFVEKSVQKCIARGIESPKVFRSLSSIYLGLELWGKTLPLPQKLMDWSKDTAASEEMESRIVSSFQNKVFRMLNGLEVYNRKGMKVTLKLASSDYMFDILSKNPDVIPFRQELWIPKLRRRLDIVIGNPKDKQAIEVDGPHHFVVGTEKYLGTDKFYQRVFRGNGWHVEHVTLPMWQRIERTCSTEGEAFYKAEFLREVLERFNF